MDQRTAPTSRKRHRPEDISASSYRVSHSAPMSARARNNSRVRPVSQQSDADLLIPSAGDTQGAAAAAASALEPLHPPIPNFSVISQGAPRPNSIPHSSAEPPGGMIYNIALPLPNPGRAHRFCQACDHVNHVRRKLCTNCGAPKPSAVRNAVGVGVRSITEVDTASSRRPQSNAGFKQDGYPHVAPAPSPYPGVDMQHRFGPHGLVDSEKGQRNPEPVPNQARSLAMRCPGDDIPLLGSHQKGPTFPNHDPQTARRIRTGQAILSEPLVNLNSLQSQDAKNIGVAMRHNSGNMDFNQKVFPNHPLDREYLTLPSMQGVPNPKVSPTMAPNAVSSRGISVPRGPPVSLSGTERPADDSLPEDVLPVSRGPVGHGLDGHRGQRRYPNVHGLRQLPKDIDSGQIYTGVPDLQTNPSLLYRQSPDLFHTQQNFRQDDREQLFRHEIPRADAFYQPLGMPNPDLERSFPLQQHDPHRLAQGTTRVPDPLTQPAPIPGISIDRSRQNNAESRAPVSQLNLSVQKADDHLHQSTLEESSRTPDDGRFAIENILMSHKGAGGQSAP